MKTKEDILFENPHDGNGFYPEATVLSVMEEAKGGPLDELKIKINDRLDLAPGNPSLRERGMIDAYTNVLNWIDSIKAEKPEQPQKPVFPIIK